MQNVEHLTFNGINGATGDYLLPAMTPAEISKIAQGETQGEAIDAATLAELKWRNSAVTSRSLGLEEGRDPKDLSSVGWGIVFAFEDGRTDQIMEALGPLLALRQRQAGGLYKEFTGVASLRPGESKNKWLARHGAGPGPVDPTRVPYYLLLVGDPERIPYRFQYQLGVQFAVGRIDFDSIDGYDHYARSVVAAETGGLALPRRAVFFGVHNQGDAATSQSAQQLVEPLAAQMAADQPDWTVETLLKEDATKARLWALLGGADTPAFLFTASHGMGFPKDDPRQLPHQGALLCQDWPGPLKWQGAIPEDHYFSVHDVGDDARLHGLMTFHFACYGAGTPLLDDFAHQAFKDRVDIAPRPFIARLPQRLISHPQGGALAAVGHVERAWTYSFRWRRAGAQTTVFKSTLKRLMDGHPVGSALEFFPERFAELSTMLSADLEDVKFGAKADDLELAGLWTANNDARSYVIVGDPAVRLPVAAAGGAVTNRDAVDLQAVGNTPAPVVAAPAQTRAMADEPPTAGFGAGGVTTPVAGGRAGLAVTTSIAADVDDPASGQVAVRTRIGPDGDVETVISANQAGNEEVLELHRRMVDAALDARVRSPRPEGEAADTLGHVIGGRESRLSQ